MWKIPSSSDKTASAARPILYSWAATITDKLALTSSSSSVVFKGLLQQPLPASVTTRKTGSSSRRPAGNTSEWSSSRLAIFSPAALQGYPQLTGNNMRVTHLGGDGWSRAKLGREALASWWWSLWDRFLIIHHSCQSETSAVIFCQSCILIRDMNKRI